MEFVWSLFGLSSSLFVVCVKFCFEVWSLFRVCSNYGLSLFEVRMEFVWSSFELSSSLFIVCLEFV